MPELRQHTLEFTPEEYQRFRAVLKTQVILKQERVFGFFIDDMVLDDRGDVLRFKLAYMPPLLRKLDVNITQTDSKVALSWNTPSLPWWDMLATVLSAVAISIFTFTRPALRNDVTIESMVFIALLNVWVAFLCFRRKRHVIEGGERFAKAMESMSNRARYETQQAGPAAATV